ncbi:hypothetical protein PG987_007142 [Apiospora arundinis]
MCSTILKLHHAAVAVHGGGVGVAGPVTADGDVEQDVERAVGERAPGALDANVGAGEGAPDLAIEDPLDLLGLPVGVGDIDHQGPGVEAIGGKRVVLPRPVGSWQTPPGNSPQCVVPKATSEPETRSMMSSSPAKGHCVPWRMASPSAQKAGQMPCWLTGALLPRRRLDWMSSLPPGGGVQESLVSMRPEVQVTGGRLAGHQLHGLAAADLDVLVGGRVGLELVVGVHREGDVPHIARGRAGGALETIVPEELHAIDVRRRESSDHGREQRKNACGGTHFDGCI